MSHADFLCTSQKMKNKKQLFVPEAKPNDDLDFIQFLLGKRFDMYINDTKKQLQIAEMIVFLKSI